VLDGPHLVSGALGARRAVLRAEPGPPLDAVRAALRERRAAGRDSARVVLVAGRAGLSRRTTGGGPVLAQDVETLARVALIARHGVDRFRSRGTRAEPGTALVTVSGAVAVPGVHEVGLGTPLARVLALAGGTVGPDGPALLVGGHRGTWLPLPDALPAPLSREGLRRWQAEPGAGVVHVLPARTCGLAESARVLTRPADRSARRCGPCRDALPGIAAVLHRASRGDASADPSHLAGVARGACHHVDGAARFALSALRVFGDEVTAHRAGGCAAAVRS
jgi:NADH:ubiquinone oxidoreductase subunit F (NADH-binding)